MLYFSSIRKGKVKPKVKPKIFSIGPQLFPGMLPTTFTTTTERDAKMKRTLKAKLEYAKFLQKTLDEMAPTSQGPNSALS